jgi:formylglycine-generating enzyme required for sulfatase activity
LDAGGGLAFTMCWIPAGEFDMGTSPELVDDTGLSKDERWHHVRISQGFWLAKGECANSQWQALMGAGRPTSQAKKQPAANISWDDCQAFLRKLRSPLPGWRWSLPTEAQWEYACRAGTTGLYGGSGNLDEMGWHDGNSAQQAHPVGMKKANAWGLCDMHGNVAEWCADWHGDYPAGSVTDPVGPDGGTSRVTRGGSWFSFSAACRSASRAKALPSHTSATVGFRVALVPAKPAG